MPYKDPEVRKEYRKLYTERTKENKRAYDKVYNAQNRDKKIAAAIKWDREHRSQANKRIRDWNGSHLERRKSVFLKNEYGITLEQYNEILDKQNGYCGICQTNKPGTNRKYFCVDHCHVTGVVRGLLCDRCNKGLGLFRDAKGMLVMALVYMERFQDKLNAIVRGETRVI